MATGTLGAPAPVHHPLPSVTTTLFPGRKQPGLIALGRFAGGSPTRDQSLPVRACPHLTLNGRATRVVWSTLPTVQLALDEQVHASQDWWDPKSFEQVLSDPDCLHRDPVQVMVVHGQLWLFDGHHRFTVARLRRRWSADAPGTVPARIWNLDLDRRAAAAA